MMLQKAAAELRVSATNISKWAAQGIGKIDSLDKILKSRKKVALTGPISQLKLLEDAIFELREQGITVNTFINVLRASCLLPKFRAKSFTACCSTVKRFMAAHLFTY